MINQSRTSGPTFIADKLIAVALVIWLLFFGGFSQIRALLTPSAISQVGSVVETIKTGAGRVAARNPALPTARPAVVAPAVDTLAEANARADTAYQATVQAVPIAQAPAVGAPVAPMALPTAAVLIPTVAPLAQIVVVPHPDKPVAYANSAPSPLPTLPIPTPLAVVDYRLSADGLCVIAPRAGVEYQVCQSWKYQPHEVASVADYIRSGLLPGVAVP